MNDFVEVKGREKAIELKERFEKCHRGASRIVFRDFPSFGGMFLIAYYNKDKKVSLTIKF